MSLARQNNDLEPKSIMIWVKGDLVKVYNQDGLRNVGVDTKIQYVVDPQTGRFVPEGEQGKVHLEPRVKPLKPNFGLKLKKQERKSPQIIGERPFSVYYGKIRADDDHANDIHEIANNEYTGDSYQYRKLKDEDFIRPVLVNVPKKEISLVPQDHSRYTEHIGKGRTKVFRKRA